MLSDIEIAEQTDLKPISEIARRLGLSENMYEQYGRYKAKIDFSPGKPQGKLILVTAMNPTPFGEGKTTVSIGLSDALNLLGKKVCLTLREPSLGPVFGIKGGACGGGYSQVAPMTDINLHFTGDFHAVTYASDLLSALIDNHIMQGNELKIKKVLWKRCIDLNDRALRKVKTGLGGVKNGVPREEEFTITAASEMMAILCMSGDLAELKKRLGDILIARDEDGEPIYCKDLKCVDALAILLKDAIKPNLVQTLEGTPAIVHGGPFANIAHGCNSVRALRTAAALADYTVTEAGFGAELGAEKFYDIVCRQYGFVPSATVLVVTIRGIKYNAVNVRKGILTSNIGSLKEGFCNVRRHIRNLKSVFRQNLVVAINKFPSDAPEEIEVVKKLCLAEGVECALSEGFTEGGRGCTELAEKVLAQVEKPAALGFPYPLDCPLEEKIRLLAEKIYGAGRVVYSEYAEKAIEALDERYKDFPICVAKTQYSFTPDKDIPGAPENFTMEVRDISISSGAGFLVVICGKILLMPGLAKVPGAMGMKISDEGKISGLS